MNRQFKRFLEKYPHPHRPFWDRPALSRRQFFEILGTGISGYALVQLTRPIQLLAQSAVVPIRKAKNCIFILLSGAPSHSDTFDLKEGPWTPASFQPTSYGDIRFPQGLMPRLAERLGDLVLVRSVRAWALVHSLAQTWIQIGRNPASALGSIAPHIGSIVALEKEPERTADDLLPGFISLNAGGSQVGAGYLPVTYAPLQVRPATTGLRNTTHPDGRERWESRLQLLHRLDDPLRKDSPLGPLPANLDNFYQAAGRLMYSDRVQSAFAMTDEERAAYGSSPFGDACLTATKIFRGQLGTRFLQITVGSWDHHQNIYAPTGLPLLAGQLDSGLAGLLDGLRQNSLLEQTLIVVAGEFGRTVGPLTGRQGRDHFLQQSVVFAGAGVHGGKALGATDEQGAGTIEAGWTRGRSIRNEDIEATVYSALGINWTTIRRDDPFNRGFEYVPYPDQDIYGPIHELWQ